MKIELNIPTERIANLFTSAIESGDPVTTASKGGWCWGIYWNNHNAEPIEGDGRDPWYAVVPTYHRKDFQVEVIEVADENKFQWFDAEGEPCPGDDFGASGDFEISTVKNLESGALKSHIIKRDQLRTALTTMAVKFPDHFAQILQDNTDAPCADVFLQCLCFGEEKYA